MLSVEEIRDLITNGDKYTDEEIEELRRDMYAFAELALDAWEEKERREKKGKID